MKAVRGLLWRRTSPRSCRGCSCTESDLNSDVPSSGSRVKSGWRGDAALWPNSVVAPSRCSTPTEPSWRQHHSLFLSSGIGSGCRGVIIIMHDAEVSGDMKREQLTAVVSMASESVPRVSNFSCISLRSHENSTATGSGCCCTRQQHKRNQIAGDNCSGPSDVIITEAIGRHMAV